jgi:predicted porin
MKKSLIALAALAAVGVASAQSSVTIWGVVDVAVSGFSAKATNAAGQSFTKKMTALTSGNNMTSQLGFRGTEDLGGGMAASFWLEGTLGADSGGLGANLNPFAAGGPADATGGTANNGGAFGASLFDRRSTVSLSGGWGEIRLGRDYTPTFWNDTVFDPYGTVGVGTNLISVARAYVGTAPTGAVPGIATGNGDPQYVRSNNTVGYFLPPNLGGIYGQLMYAFGEQPNANGNGGGVSSGRYIGGRLGYANGPLDVAIAYAETIISDSDAAASGAVFGGPGAYPIPGIDVKLQSANLAASYDFGVVKLMGEYSTNKFKAPGGSTSLDGYLLGLTAPVGAGLVKFSYSAVDYDDGWFAGWRGSKANKWALGYVHNLSKRTALYATVARVSNKNGSNQRLTATNPNAYDSLGVPRNATGYDLGIRHAF